MQRPRCSTCRVDGIQGSFENYRHLKPIEPWKFGQLCRCAKCRRYWFWPESRNRLSRIEDRLLPLARYWNGHRLAVDEEVLQQLGRIGGIKSDYHENIAIPCTVRHVSGAVHQNAIVLFSKSPPHYWYKPSMVHWADEIDTIAPSPDALPFDVRQASAAAREISMGFSPTVVIDQAGRSYTLGWETQFFHVDGVRGPEITLSSYKGNWEDKIGCGYGLLFWFLAEVIRLIHRFPRHQAQALPKRPRVVSTPPVEAYYFVDWFEGCEQLLIPRLQQGTLSEAD